MTDRGSYISANVSLQRHEWGVYSQISHLIPNSFGILFKRTRGVLPIFPRMLGRMLGGLVLSWRQQKIIKHNQHHVFQGTQSRLMIPTHKMHFLNFLFNLLIKLKVSWRLLPPPRRLCDSRYSLVCLSAIWVHFGDVLVSGGTLTLELPRVQDQQMKVLAVETFSMKKCRKLFDH